MSRFGTFLRGETRIDFVGRRRTWMQISASILLISVAALLIRDLNLGIEFRGGLSLTTVNPSGATVEDLRAVTSKAGITDVVIQSVDEGAAVRLQTPALDEAAQDALVSEVAALTGTPSDAISIDAVGPTFGALILRQSLIALGVFLVAVMLFMTWRLEWKMAATGIIALLHDLIITAGIYAITGFEVTPATVVAALTILGYSLYDTVVVFDKIEEQIEIQGDRQTVSEIVNRSANLVLARSILTALTSLLPVGSILFVGAFIFGATSLRDFALALFVGIAVGTYSSLFVATPLLATWKEREPEWISRRHRLAAKASERGRRPAAGATTREAPTTARSGRPPTPRPPKKRKR